MTDNVSAISAYDPDIVAAQLSGVYPERTCKLLRPLYRHNPAAYFRTMKHIYAEAACKIDKRFVYLDECLVIVGEKIRCRLLA